MTTMTANEPAVDFERELRNVWKLLSHSVARSRSVFGRCGAAMRASDVPDDGERARSAKSYELEENYTCESAEESLENLLENARKGRQTALLSAAWRAVNELEHVTGCGVRVWNLAMRESEGKYSFSDEAGKDAEKLSGHIEELFDWTLETMRLRYSSADGGWGRQALIEAGAIAKKEGAIARRVFDKTATECACRHEALSAEGSCAIPGEVAFLDYIATLSSVGGHLSALLELSGRWEK